MNHVHNANIQVIRYTSIVLAALYPATIIRYNTSSHPPPGCYYYNTSPPYPQVFEPGLLCVRKLLEPIGQ